MGLLIKVYSYKQANAKTSQQALCTNSPGCRVHYPRLSVKNYPETKNCCQIKLCSQRKSILNLLVPQEMYFGPQSCV